jgi:Mrp family chromosome partitioning ATPase
MFPESIRGLALTLERAGGKMPRTITVTSALPGDGKSLLAAALALELAAAGRRVLLVDGDLRRGVVHRFFGAPVGPGLADLLCGDHAVDDVVRRHEPSGLEYVSRGGSRVVPYQEQQRVGQLIQYAKANDQIVVFDSAPVLATTGTSVLAGISDRTILVARWGRTTRRTIELALQKLQSASRDDVVVAINMVNPRRHALYAFTDAGLFSPQLRKYYP